MEYPRVMALTLLASASLQSACSVNGYGIVTTRIDHGDGALVSSLYAPGINFRIGNDAGVSLGMTKRVCILQLTPDSPGEGRYYLRSPVIGECLSSDLTTAGVELRAADPEYSLSVGYRRTTIMASQPAGGSLDYLVRFDAASPDKTMVRLYQNGELE
jgi:hypothetical protein